jgi:hypothetical protein
MSNLMFPARFTLEADDGSEVSIELSADGTWSGDGDAFLNAVANAEFEGSPLDSLAMWLLVRAIKGNAEKMGTAFVGRRPKGQS